MDELKQEHDCHGDCDHCGDDCVDMDGATVTLTMEDDSVVECAVIAVYPAGDKEYIALLPLDEEGDNEDGEVYIYRFQETDEAGPVLENIEDDDEYQTAADAFDAYLDKLEAEEDAE